MFYWSRGRHANSGRLFIFQVAGEGLAGKSRKVPKTLERPVLCIMEWGQCTGFLFTVVDGDLNVRRGNTRGTF